MTAVEPEYATVKTSWPSLPADNTPRAGMPTSQEGACATRADAVWIAR